jgi:hypothetical protein
LRGEYHRHFDNGKTISGQSEGERREHSSATLPARLFQMTGPRRAPIKLRTRFARHAIDHRSQNSGHFEFRPLWKSRGDTASTLGPVKGRSQSIPAISNTCRYLSKISVGNVPINDSLLVRIRRVGRHVMDISRSNRQKYAHDYPENQTHGFLISLIGLGDKNPYYNA